MSGMEVKVMTIDTDGRAGLNFTPQRFLSIKLVVVAFTAMMVTWSFGWLYLGETWDPLSKTPNIQIAIMNCDDGINQSVVSQLPPWFLDTPIFRLIGYQPLADTLLAQSVYNESSPAGQIFFWRNYTCKQLPAPALRTWGRGCGPYTQKCYEEALKIVDDGDYWNVIFIPNNFSTGILSWFTASRAIYPSAQSIKIMNNYPRGRNFTTYTFVNAVLNAVWGQILAGLYAIVAATAEVSYTLVDGAVYNQPLKFVAHDIRPVALFGQHFASYVFCIIIWLCSTFCVAVFNQFKSPAEIKKLTGGVVTKLEMAKSMIIKMLFAWFYMWIFCILIVCILYSLGREEAQWVGHNGGYAMAFAWWLSVCNLSMNTFLLYVLGPDKFSSISAFFLVLQLTSGGAIFSEELSSPFFQIGHGLPFYYAVRGFRTIFFGPMQNVMFANWLVIFGWNVLSTLGAAALVVVKLDKMDSLPKGAGAPVVVAVAG